MSAPVPKAIPGTKPSLAALRREMQALASPAKARAALRFVKTGPGEYAEGDRFLGLTAADLHALVRRHRDLPLADVRKMLRSPIHEERAAALLILVEQFRRGSERGQRAIYRLYLCSTAHINNWDLVDCSAEHIVGPWLAARARARRKVLEQLARSTSLWERRIAIVATLHFIRQNQFADTLRIAAKLLRDDHDLIHKAAGWMLREVGKRDLAILERFLRRHAPRMPRTMLRYAIERFPERKRQAHLRA